MPTRDIPFILLHLSVALIITLFYIILRMKNKTQIHYVFLSTIGLLFLWSVGQMLEVYTRNIYGYTLPVFVYFYFIGVCFLPVSLLLTGIIFMRTTIRFSPAYLLLFIPGTVSYAMVLTNKYHHLFFVEYAPFNDQIVYGRYFLIHNLLSYLYILAGLYYLAYFSIRNSGFFSKQSVLIFMGILGPLVVNMLSIYKLVVLPFYATPVAFSFAIACFAFAISKFKFLNIVPIALQSVVDRISDAFVVVNEKLNIIDYNKAFTDAFSGSFTLRRNDSLVELLTSCGSSNVDVDKLVAYIHTANRENRHISFEKHIVIGSLDKYYDIEITPIISNSRYLGSIIMLRDISEHKKNIEIIKQTQEQLVEKERMATLGQLIGGIAHNLRTPIMSISGGLEAVAELAKEYEESIEDGNVTGEDHHEIAAEMLAWTDKMKAHCSYMSDIITTVKGQAIQLNTSSTSSFTIDELIKRVDILLKYELLRRHCSLKADCTADRNLEIKGEVNNLVQILDNLIINSMQAYEGSGGRIDFAVAAENGRVKFTVRDYGKGIPAGIREKLFKEMVTTKGKHGTGLGLYMSYATVKGKFGGNMWFESEEGKGTVFYITLPFTIAKEPLR